MSDDNTLDAANAINSSDILMNLMCLKQKLLIKKQKCNNCEVAAKEWLFIGKCHHTICENCINISKYSAHTCPKCKIDFDPEVDLSSISALRKGYCEMEEIVWNVLALENGLMPGMDKIKEKSKPNEKSKPDNPTLSTKKSQGNANSIEQSKDLSLETSKENHNSELLPDYNQCIPQSTIKSLDNVQEILVSEKANCVEQSRDLSFVQLNSAENKKMSRDLDTVNNLEVEPNAESTYSFISNNSNSDSNKSEDDIIEGTPGKYHALNPTSSISSANEQSSKKIVISYSNLEEKELEILKTFLEVFSVEVDSSWNDSVTHLVMQTGDDNIICGRTKKYFLALYSHCCIVSLDWVVHCILSKTLLPEIDYMPLDSSKQPAALVSWQARKNISKSPMEWAKDCNLFFHSSIEQTNESYSDIITFAKKAGFVIANQMNELNDQFKMRFIISEQTFVEPVEDMISLTRKHKAVPLFLDWVLECLGQFRLVPISSDYHLIPLDMDLVNSTQMDESYFVLNG